MPKYKLTNEEGRSLTIRADRPPTEEEIAQIFSQTAQSDVSWWDEAAYEFDKTNADWQNWWIALQAKTGMGEFARDEDGISMKSGVALYGNDWLTASYEERKEMIQERSKEDLLEKYADVIDFQEETGGSTSAQLLGMVGKTLASPTTLAPVGKTLTAATVIGGLIGLQHTASEQVVEGELDVAGLAKGAGVGLAGGAAANRLEALGRSWMASRAAKKSSEAAANKAATLNDEIMNGMVDGLDQKQAVARAKQRLALSDADVLEVFHSGKLSIPSPEKVAKVVEANQAEGVAVTKADGLLSRLVVPISTRVRAISEPVFGRLRELEAKTHWKTAESLEAVSAFTQRASKLKKDPNFMKMERALLNGQRDEAKAIAQENFPDMVPALNNVNKVLDDLYGEMSDTGLQVGYLDNYFPRKVKDLGKLRESLGRVGGLSDLDKLMDARAAKEGLSSWQELPKDVQDQVVNSYLDGMRSGKFGLGLAKARTIEEITEGMQEHYHSASDSLLMYITDAVKEVEKRRFFGKSAKFGVDGKIDIDNSVGSLVARERLKGAISAEQEGDLRAILVARFGLGEQASNKVVSAARSLQTSALLAQFDSAVIQLGDIGSSAYMHGIWPTLKALGGRKGIPTAEEMGILRNVAADLDSMGFGQQVVDKTLRWSGFRAVDRLGKETLMKAAHIKNTAWAKKSPEKLVERWGGVFGEETGNLVADLKAGRMTDNVKLLLFNELSEVQPISLSEMPEQYLKSPGGRIVYSLKSFGLKQLDLIKRTAIDEMRNGNYQKGLANMARYAATMGAAGGTISEVRNWMQTGEFDPADIPDNTFETLASIMFLSEYSREKYLKLGKIGGFLEELLMPAAPQVVDTTLAPFIQAVQDDEKRDPENFKRVMKDVPVLGKAFYYWMLGGAEARLERERAEELKDLIGG